MKHVILAGNHAQAMHYIRTQKLKLQDCVIANSIETVMGLEGFTLHKVGNWKNRGRELVNRCESRAKKDA